MSTQSLKNLSILTPAAVLSTFQKYDEASAKWLSRFSSKFVGVQERAFNKRRTTTMNVRLMQCRVRAKFVHIDPCSSSSSPRYIHSLSCFRSLCGCQKDVCCIDTAQITSPIVVFPSAAFSQHRRWQAIISLHQVVSSRCIPFSKACRWPKASGPIGSDSLTLKGERRADSSAKSSEPHRGVSARLPRRQLIFIQNPFYSDTDSIIGPEGQNDKVLYDRMIGILLIPTLCKLG